MGPFGEVAREYLNAGLAPIPIGGGEDGKRPLVRHKAFHERPPSKAAVEAWLKQPSKTAANIGTITGPASNLTVVDVDDPSLVEIALKSFGDTPLIQRTPRGGFHLLYRYSGEGSPTRLNGRPIDVRGKGGYVVLSPSQISGKAYRFERGELLTDIRQLPTANGLPKGGDGADVKLKRLVDGEGRNNSVFKALKDWAAEHALQSEEHAYLVAQSFDAELNEEPLSERELRATARKIFEYQDRGTLFTSGVRFARMSESDYRKLRDSTSAQRAKGAVRSIAVDLFHRASLRFGNSPDPFPISPKALARDMGIDHRVLARARDLLEESTLVRRVRDGGGEGNPRLFVWGWVRETYHKQ